MSKSSAIVYAGIGRNYDELRRKVAAEVDAINLLQGIKKRCSLAKADEVIRLRYLKGQEEWVRNFGKKK